MDNQKPNTDPKTNIDELVALSGEANLKQSRYNVPYLKFNGSTGKFALLTTDSEKNLMAEELGDEIEGVILKVRRAYTAYEKTADGGTRYFSNEHNSFKDPIVLFEKKSKEGRPRMVAEGSLDSVRNQFPNIRLVQQLYFLHNDKIVKFGVKGKSLGSFWEYVKGFEGDDHVIQFTTKIQRHQETNEGGVSYFVLDFLRSDPCDMEIVGPKIKEVAVNLDLQDKSFEAIPNKVEEEKEVGKTPEKPEEKEGEESEESDEKQVQKIPY